MPHKILSLCLGALLLATTVILLVPGAAMAAGAGRATVVAPSSLPPLTAAPVNPAFTRYLRTLHSTARSRSGATRHHMGSIPSPIDFSYLGRLNAQRGTQTAYPTDWILGPPFTTSKLPDVQDQSWTGCCWAFAAMGSLESCEWLTDKTLYSENNMIIHSGFDPSYDTNTDPNDSHSAYENGGNALMATAYLARWGGPMLQSQDPLPDEYTGYASSPPGLSPVKHVQNVDIVPPRTGPSDTNAIKAAIMTYGAVDTSMCADEGMASGEDSEYYNPGEDCYYFDGAPGQQDHDVDIVGWFDDYPRTAFSDNGYTDEPQGDGAWVVRNSWGPSWNGFWYEPNGSSTKYYYYGYFLVSYYDTNFAHATNAVFDKAQPTSNYSAQYTADPLGLTNEVGYTGSDTACIARQFTPASSQDLDALSFYATAPGSYTLYVGSSLSTLGADGSGSCAMAGYHTVPLSLAVPLTSGRPFVAAVKLTTPGWDEPIPLQEQVAGYTSHATSAPGLNYISPDGKSWADLTSQSGLSKANVCLAAFTVASASNLATAPKNTARPVVSGTPAVGQTLSSSKGSWSGNPAPTIVYRWQRNGVKISGATKATYVVQAADCDQKLSCRVMATNVAGSVSATSNTVIPVHTLTITKPTAASKWPSGSAQSVAWTMNPAVSTGEFQVSLVSAAGHWYVNKQVLPKAGKTSYSTTVTASVPAGSYKAYVYWRPTVGSGSWTVRAKSASFKVT